MAGYAWASHRVLPLDGDDLAVLADGSSGWCVLTRDAYRQLRAELPLELDDSIGNPPAFSVRQKWSYAAIANFIAGVIPPSAMLGRSWLYVHSQR
ncbi:hypothetical protein VWY99_22155, partial [Xanthomonas citri pv. citri]